MSFWNELVSNGCSPWPAPCPFSPGIGSEDLPDSVGLQQCSYWSPHQKPFWKAYFFPRAPRLQWGCTSPVDDEGSGNRLHLTWVLSWNILSHPSMNVSDVVLIDDCCSDDLVVLNRWTLSRSMLSDTTETAHTITYNISFTIPCAQVRDCCPFDGGDSRLSLRWISHLRQNRLKHPHYGVVPRMAGALSARILLDDVGEGLHLTATGSAYSVGHWCPPRGP